MNAVHDHQVVRAERWGDGVPVIVCWDIKADCGCLALEGMRTDRDEPVIGFYGCDEHKNEMAALHESYMRDAAEMSEGLPNVDAQRGLHEVLVERMREAIG